MLPLILLLVFAAVTTLTYAFLTRPREEVLPTGAYAAARFEAAHAPSGLVRMLYPLLNLLSPLFAPLPFADYRRSLADNLRKAGFGDSVTVNHIFAMKLISAIATPLILGRLFDTINWPPMFLATMIGGFLLPDKMITDIKKKRWRQILRTMPGAVDVLSLSVEAGLDFQVAMQRYVERGTPGPLRDEFSTILNDMRLGKTRAEAIRDFGRRVDIQEVGSFVSVLVQADQLGVPIGEVLRSQAAVMRVQRFQRAEQEGARASQKLLVPLVFFIFPAVLIVILGPVVLHFISAQQ
jgi:tight adherence protein C